MSNNNKKTTTTTTTDSVSVAGPNDTYTNMCPDGHACDNDASCVESLLHENKYVCDCHDAYLQTGRVYAGLSCQHVATEYCTESGEISQSSFCTNQGSCKSKASGATTAAHAGCKCPKGYTGDHCQYIQNSVPSDMSYFLDGTTFAARMKLAQEGEGIPPAAIVVPILLVTFGVLGFVLYKYRGFGWTGAGHVVDKNKKADENMLEADGSNTLNNKTNPLFLSTQRRNSTPAFSSTHKAALMDPPDFDDLLEQSDHVKFHMDPTGTASHKLFASDPGLQFAPTADTTGSGSPTNYMNDDRYGTGGTEAFDEYDPSEFPPTDEDDVAAYDPTFT